MNIIDQETYDIIRGLLNAVDKNRKPEWNVKVDNYMKTRKVRRSCKKLNDKRIGKRYEKLYAELKASITAENMTNQVTTGLSNVAPRGEIIHRLKTIFNGKHAARYSLSECIFLLHENIKNSEEQISVKVEFENILKANIKMTAGYAYKYLQYYNMCKKYTKLKYVTISTRNLLNNLTYFKSEMEKEEQWWTENVDTAMEVVPVTDNDDV